ncbi:MAG: hypothetical protein ACOYLF_02940 [Blastocatellia bacterium]|jgi:hypothetical protein
MTDDQRSAGMLYLIIAKSMIELLLLAGVASYVAWFNFHPLIHGVIDIANAEQVAGWAFNPEVPPEPVEVQLFLDGRFIASQSADKPRPDLIRAGVTTGSHHGYCFTIAPQTLSPGRHIAEVFVVQPALNGYRTLIPLSSPPASFTVER